MENNLSNNNEYEYVGKNVFRRILRSIFYDRLEKIIQLYKPEIVFHAAAHKHVPLMENNPLEAIKNNVFGTYNVASLANMLAGGVLVQRFGDLLDGRRSTPDRIKSSIITPTLTSATPGDLSLVIPYRQMKSIIEMLFALDKIAPGVASRYTLLYGVEVKFYSARVLISNELEINAKTR